MTWANNDGARYAATWMHHRVAIEHGNDEHVLQIVHGEFDELDPNQEQRCSVALGARAAKTRIDSTAVRLGRFDSLGQPIHAVARGYLTPYDMLVEGRGLERWDA